MFGRTRAIRRWPSRPRDRARSAHQGGGRGLDRDRMHRSAGRAGVRSRLSHRHRRHVPRRNRVGLTDEVHGIHGVAEKLRHDRRAIRPAPPRCGGRDLAESTQRAAACERVRSRLARLAELVHHEIADTPGAVRREAPTSRARPVVDPGAQPRSSDDDLLLVVDPVAAASTSQSSSASQYGRSA